MTPHRVSVNDPEETGDVLTLVAHPEFSTLIEGYGHLCVVPCEGGGVSQRSPGAELPWEVAGLSSVKLEGGHVVAVFKHSEV